MDEPAREDEVEQLSELIGAIYDCAVDPDRWDKTLDDIRQLLDCANAILSVVDVRTGALRVHKIVGIEPHWVALMAVYAPDMMELYRLLPDLDTRPIDEPLSPWRELGGPTVLANRYYQEWAKPQGLIDSVAVSLMRTADRRAEIAMGRRENVGVITEREVRLMRLLAPHLRRAVTISDLIDMKSLEANALTETLNEIAAGIVLVGEDGAIVHANRAAERMLERGRPIRSANGRLAAGDAWTNAELQRIIAEAAREEAGLGAAGIGMVLAAADGTLATAHILPLARGVMRTRLDPRARAAIFIASNDAAPPADLGPIAKAYGLSRAETMLLVQIAQGRSVPEAAAYLGVAKTTAKTHMSRIFAKTGTRRQPALMSLIHRLAPVIMPTGQHEDDQVAANRRDQ